MTLHQTIDWLNIFLPFYKKFCPLLKKKSETTLEVLLIPGGFTLTRWVLRAMPFGITQVELRTTREEFSQFRKGGREAQDWTPEKNVLGYA